MDRGGRRNGGGGGGPVGGLIRLVSSGVQMATEYKDHRRAGQEARAHDRQEESPSQRATGDDDALAACEVPSAQSQAPPPYTPSQPWNTKAVAGKNPYEESHPVSGDYLIADDEKDWELDDMLTRMENQPECGSEKSTIDSLVRNVARMPTGSTMNVVGYPHRTPIPFPVIIPQRRPRTKARGFVQAYAPVLAGCGIDQETFLQFLKNFHTASQASPVFPCIQVAAGIAGFAPSLVAMAVSTAAGMAASVGEEMEVRARKNNYLDRINEELFKPSGLYAMIIKYKPDDGSQAGQPKANPASMFRFSTTDMSTDIARTPGLESSGKGNSMKDKMAKFRTASSTTQGAAELPEAAPLIFPEIDYRLAHDGPETFKDKAKDAKKFLADYLDRRAQMQYVRTRSASSLTVR